MGMTQRLLSLRCVSLLIKLSLLPSQQQRLQVTSVRVVTSATATTTVTVTANRDLTTTLTNKVTVVETATIVDHQTVTRTEISINAARPTSTSAFISLSGSWEPAQGNTVVDFEDSFYTAVLPRDNSSTLAATFNGA